MVVGVLALQGDFAAHARTVRDLGPQVREVRTPADLDGVGALVLPGGESTTMVLGIEREGLAGPLRELCASGVPVLATCAGMIVLDRDHLGIGDWTCRRNAFGRQVRSFELDLRLDVGDPDPDPYRAVFIRAPWVDRHGPDVRVLAAVDGHPVAVGQDNLLAVAFHPELTGESRLHRWLLGAVRDG